MTVRRAPSEAFEFLILYAPHSFHRHGSSPTRKVKRGRTRGAEVSLVHSAKDDSLIYPLTSFVLTHWSSHRVNPTGINASTIGKSYLHH